MIILITVLSYSSASAQTIEYEYDVLNRLTEVDESENGKVNFKYDAAGNLLSVDLPDSQKFLTTSDERTSRTSSTSPDTVVVGWTPYVTKGVDVKYSLITEVINQSTIDQEIEDNKALGVKNEVEVNGGDEVEGKLELTEEFEVEHKNSDLEIQDIKEFDIFPNPEKGIISALNIIQQISAEMGQPGGANVYRDFSVIESKPYVIKGSVKAEELQHTAVQVITNYYDENNEFIGHKNIINILQDSDWVSVDSVVTPPSGAVTARVHLQILSPKVQGTGVASFSEFTMEGKSLFR